MAASRQTLPEPSGETKRTFPRHRRFAPLRERATGEPYPIGEKERATLARHAPLTVLALFLYRDDAFLAAVAAVRAGQPVENFARRWARSAPKGGGHDRGRRVVAALLEMAAENELEPTAAVLAMAACGVWTTAPLNGSDPRHWPHAKRWPEAARMLTRLGADQCITCGDCLDSNWQRRHCARCEPVRYVNGRDLGDRERSDREAVLGLLRAAGDALGID